MEHSAKGMVGRHHGKQRSLANTTHGIYLDFERKESINTCPSVGSTPADLACLEWSWSRRRLPSTHHQWLVIERLLSNLGGTAPGPGPTHGGSAEDVVLLADAAVQRC